MLKEFGIFMVGGACGFAGAYLLLKSRYEAMVKEADEAALAWVREREGRTDGKDELSEAITKSEQVLQHEKDMTNYNKIRERMVSEGVIGEDKKTIYRISQQDFVIDDEDFDHVSLEYYTEDEALYEEGGPMIPNIEDVVGADNLAYLHGAEDVIYVRNEDLRTDYEVNKIVGSYTG